AQHFGIVGPDANLLPPDLTASLIAIGIVAYFWRLNTIGIHESSERALRIMQVTTCMVVMIIVWCAITLLRHPAHLPPLPVPANLTFGVAALGWLEGTALPSIGVIGLMIALGHSVLAMSGEESLAQVARELEHPKLRNLKRAGLVIFVFSMVFTSLVSFFA